MRQLQYQKVNHTTENELTNNFTIIIIIPIIIIIIIIIIIQIQGTLSNKCEPNFNPEKI